VFSSNVKKTLLPWTILQIQEEEYTFIDFFNLTIKPRIEDCELVSAHIGPQKGSLDPVDSQLLIQPTVASFGRFIKFCVDSRITNEGEEASVSNPAPPLNAFDVLMFAARSRNPRPAVIETYFVQKVNERNNKDKLYNNIISFMSARDLSFRSVDEVKSIGVELVRLLRDVLWYIDGHHHVFQQRSSPLPAEFGCFTDYNNPELSKHRKRRTSNLSADALEQFLLDLSVVLNENYWERDGWCDMKLLIISLSSSISGYIDYLRSKNKRMLLCHRAPTPVRELSEHLRIRFLNQSSLATNELLQPIESAMENLSFFEQINITSLLPSSDLVKKHRVLEILTKTGLSLSAVLLTYSPGSNIGNMHFMWKVPDDDPVDALERSQPVIEDIKKDIPVYHSRLMRSTMYNKFGRVAPTVKPAVPYLWFG
jgi:hypothetical protein